MGGGGTAGIWRHALTTALEPTKVASPSHSLPSPGASLGAATGCNCRSQQPPHRFRRLRHHSGNWQRRRWRQSKGCGVLTEAMHSPVGPLLPLMLQTSS